MRYLTFLLLPGLLAAERVDLLVMGWNVRPSGTIQSGIVPIDLRSDLALRNETRFFGKLTLRPGDRHNITIEGAPLEFTGENQLARTIVYNGREYSVRDTVSSSASLTYFFGGYQYDLVRGRGGYLRAGGGAAYLDAAGQITSRSTGLSAERAHRVGLPLASVEGAAMLNRFLEIGGDIKGLPLGSYGHFVHASATARLMFGRVGVVGGWALIDADIHERGGAAGVAARFQGPVFGLRLRL